MSNYAKRPHYNVLKEQNDGGFYKTIHISSYINSQFNYSLHKGMEQRCT